MTWVDWNRIFEVTCPERLVRYTSSSAARVVEHDDRLGRQTSVLGRSERHHVDTRPPGQIGG